MGIFQDLTMTGLNFLSTLFVFVVGIAALTVIVLWIVDASQSRDAIRHNYPVVGRFRYIFNRLGEFFRQYFFALDREEMPFNRAQREWVYKSSQGRNNTQPFGSTLNLNLAGTPIFINAAFPFLEDKDDTPPELVFGPQTPNPYRTRRLINVSGMSYGAISRPAVRALSRGAQLAGCWLNTGEGGLSKYHLEGGCDLVFQFGTAKFGVRKENGEFCEGRLRQVAGIEQVRMIEIKLSQGAKPGKGGILPSEKVTREIARIRGIPKGQPAISPNRFPEVGNVGELLDFIDRVRGIAGKPVGFKSAFGDFAWLESLCDEIHRRGFDSAPDFITVDGGEGGTGAAPMPHIDNVGVSVRQALPAVVDVLVRKGLRERIRVIASGKLVTPAEACWAYCAGADSVNSARGFMFALGCIQAMRCHTNNCPTGVTTHKKRLQGGLDVAEKSTRVKNYVARIEQGMGAIAHSCGVDHARALTRAHVRIAQPNGISVPLDVLCPPCEEVEGAREAAE